MKLDARTRLLATKPYETMIYTGKDLFKVDERVLKKGDKFQVGQDDKGQILFRADSYERILPLKLAQSLAERCKPERVSGRGMLQIVESPKGDESFKKSVAAVESFKNLVGSLNGKVGPADQLYKLWSKLFAMSSRQEYTYDSVIKLINLATRSIKGMRFGQPKGKAATAAALGVRKELADIEEHLNEGNEAALEMVSILVEGTVGCMVLAAGLSEKNAALLNKFERKVDWWEPEYTNKSLDAIIKQGLAE